MAFGRLVASVMIPLLFGCLALWRVSQGEDFDLYRRVDVVQLIAAGMCFGVALVGSILWLRRPRRV
jgi:hypothetical protein